MNLNSNTEGSVKLCCSINENIHVTDNIGKEINFGTHSIEEIWNTDYMQTIRKQLLNNERPSACDVCWRLEDMGLNSSRTSAPAEFKSLGIYTKDHMQLDPPLPTSLELRLGNFCNLRCNSCWSLSSDGIFDERKAMLSDSTLPLWAREEFQNEIKLAEQANFAWWESDTFMNSIKSIAPTLKRLYLTGGEPTLIKKNIEVMRMILDSGNTDCYVALTTNLTNWNSDFFDTMAEFSHGEFQVSIDAIGDKNKYIRYPTQWQQVENNMASIYYNFPVDWKIKHFTVMQTYNYDQVPEIISWVSNQRKYWSDQERLKNLKNSKGQQMSTQSERIHIWSPIILDNPSQLNIRNMPLELRMIALQQLKEFNISGPSLIESPNFWYKHGIENTIKYLESTDTSDHAQWVKFFEYNDILDSKRKINFGEIFPKLSAHDPRENK